MCSQVAARGYLVLRCLGGLRCENPPPSVTYGEFKDVMNRYKGALSKAQGAL